MPNYPLATSRIFENSFLAEELKFNENSNKAFVYTINLTNCNDLILPHTIHKFWQCLSTDEKSRATKYYTKQLSDQYIISHGILRYILSYYTSQFPQNIEFTYNEYGKPFLKNNSHNIQFNMSHSHGVIAYIITLNYQVGIDIELHDDSLNIQELIDLIFTQAEYKFFTTLKDKEKLKFFYNLWTKKESLIKANGRGLSYPINTIEAMILTFDRKIFLASKENNYDQAWYYFPLEVPKNYSGAIAIEHKINKIIYLEMNNQRNTFDNIRLKYFH
ncbi:Phosphopantetheinyl transferase N-terminal domain protein (plasmid) [Candidatus Trichorickettsia mobilis]|uniref:4'-phosphopantetheinyl transferase family protein n=1 Tax=Candidatus Trichorickettsia mobilis TaxID=1346319 RepID=UPI002B260B47|nr:4'-phosphopantetheinyl transferase superfamily protein [Candidatus Trichorickettsia mobilis]WPY01912.1 Phosphopantetheinyl transferase N-terminal domain protein [Candidatus Trichorickettsia mobilis]